MSLVQDALIPDTFEDVVARLGGIPLNRIRAHPSPGAATEADVLAAGERENRLCELVDGVLVEKTAGYGEAYLAVCLAQWVNAWVDERNLGLVTGPDGALRLFPGMIRIPDLAFVSWDRMPGRRVPRDPFPDLAPDFAVEILSPSNTEAEMERKCSEYFTAGARLVWLTDPADRSVRVFTATDRSTVFRAGDVLTGDPVLPGFSLAVAEWFGKLDRCG